MIKNRAKITIHIIRILTIVATVLLCDSFLNNATRHPTSAAYAQQAQQGINKIPQIAPVTAPGLNPSKNQPQSELNSPVLSEHRRLREFRRFGSRSQNRCNPHDSEFLLRRFSCSQVHSLES